MNIVIGSGPSGTHAALTLLGRGKPVELWDVGRDEPAFPHPEADFHALKPALADPQDYFLGRQFEALLPPAGGELLRYPPSRRFLLEPEDAYWPFTGDTFRPFASLAQGGLAAGWGVNAVSYDEDDLRDWPLSLADLREAYAEACRRLPVAGVDDCLSPCFPGVTANQPAVRLSGHDAALLSHFERRAASVERWCHIRLGHARLAVNNTPGHPSACRSCGRCLWGCPHGSLYHPAKTTLRECQRYPGFVYRPGRLVLSLETRDGQITGIRYQETATGRVSNESCSAVFLAAGALQSGAIFLRTLRLDDTLKSTEVELNRTQSVMDTAVVKIPYIQLRGIGAREDNESFQFNRLIVAHRKPRAGSWPMHCHGEVLSLNTLLYHPLVESIPLGSRRALRLFARFRPALGVVTYFFPDRQAAGNGLSILPDSASPTGDRLHISYHDAQDKEVYIRETVRDTRRALWLLGCIPWAPMRAPAGSGIHYAGTAPMGTGPRCSDSTGRANAYRNLYFCDGAAFPSLPSKSITLNLVAHAIRVASLAPV